LRYQTVAGAFRRYCVVVEWSLNRSQSSFRRRFVETAFRCGPLILPVSDLCYYLFISDPGSDLIAICLTKMESIWTLKEGGNERASERASGQIARDNAKITSGNNVTAYSVSIGTIYLALWLATAH